MKSLRQPKFRAPKFSASLSRPPIERPLRWWLGALLVAYLVGFSIIRLFLFNYLEHDEAEELFRCQTLSWGYTAQPPLYAWILWGVVQVFGVSVLSLTIVKTGLLAGLYFLLDSVANRTIVDKRLARLATISPLLIPLFAWEMPRMAVSLLLCVAILGTILSIMQIQAKGRPRDFILLGVWLAVGTLAKYNFALFVAALFFAISMVREYRKPLLTWQIGLSLCVGAILVVPHALWVIENLKEITTRISTRSGMSGSDSSLLVGFKNLAFTFVFSLMVMVGVVWGCFRKQLFESRDKPANNDARLVNLFLLFSTILMILVVVVGGVRTFRVHWLAPILLLVPIWIFSRLDSKQLILKRLQTYGIIAGIGALGVLLAQASALCFGYEEGKFQTRDFLLAEQVQQVRDQDFVSGCIITSDPIIAGYQRLNFPNSAVHCLLHPSTPSRKGFDRGPWLIVWNATGVDGIPIPFANYLESHFNLQFSPSVIPKYVEMPGKKFRSSMTRLGYLLIWAGTETE